LHAVHAEITAGKGHFHSMTKSTTADQHLSFLAWAGLWWFSGDCVIEVRAGKGSQNYENDE
jgi:hypothetical protein